MSDLIFCKTGARGWQKGMNSVNGGAGGVWSLCCLGWKISAVAMLHSAGGTHWKNTEKQICSKLHLHLQAEQA